MTDRDLDGRVALVVGGAGAIGAACAERLAAEGARVVVADLDAEKCDGVARDIGGHGFAIDVTDPEQVAAVVDGVVDRYGGLRVAVNVTGVGGRPVRLHEYADADWSRVLDVNLTGLFRCLREELRVMLAGGGSVVNVSSVTGSAGFPTASAYTASKHGVEGLTRTAALEYAGDGIRVNAVAPGFIETELLTGRRPAGEIAGIAAAHPVGRLGTADEVAEVVAFLVSDRAAFVTGSTYRVDGGYLTGSRPG